MTHLTCDSSPARRHALIISFLLLMRRRQHGRLRSCMSIYVGGSIAKRTYYDVGRTHTVRPVYSTWATHPFMSHQEYTPQTAKSPNWNHDWNTHWIQAGP